MATTASLMPRTARTYRSEVNDCINQVKHHEEAVRKCAATALHDVRGGALWQTAAAIGARTHAEIVRSAALRLDGYAALDPAWKKTARWAAKEARHADKLAHRAGKAAREAEARG